MAVVIGVSAAWKRVLDLAHTAGVIVEVPGDVDIQLHRAQETLLQQEELTRADLDARQAILARKAADERASAARDTSFLNIRREHDLASLRGPLRPLRAMFVRSHTQRLTRRRMQPVIAAERILQDFIDARDGEVRRRVTAARTLLDAIEAIAGSPELADAVAQLALIDALRVLPDEYVLFNDVRVGYGTVPPSDMTPRGDRVDHLLIGQPGVYVIDTRDTGSRTAQDLYSRVRLVADTCRRLLKPIGFDRTVHAILAYAGTAPQQAPPDGVLALQVERVAGYVQEQPAALPGKDAERVRLVLAGSSSGARIG